jgi:cell division transport system permease protein
MSGLFTSIRRTPYQSVAAVLLLFLTLFLSLAILFSLSFLYGLLGYVESRPQVTVYFKTDTPEADIMTLREELVNEEMVQSVEYISKAQAFEIYKESNKDNPLLLEMVSADILPPSLEVEATKPIYLPEIAEVLKKHPGVDEVNFPKVIIDRLLTLTDIIRKVSFVFFSFLMFTTIVTMVTIIHFKVALKRDEIALQKLLGASNFYIRKPFLGEALFFGIFSAVMSSLIFFGILYYMNPFITSYLRGINTLALNLYDMYSITIWPLNPIFLAILFGIITFFGIVISTIATLLATRKYLR